LCSAQGGFYGKATAQAPAHQPNKGRAQGAATQQQQTQEAQKPRSQAQVERQRGSEVRKEAK